ncbi:MAG TPA: CYTH domain-containing protein [Candidatus Saccharimonadales bacterium]|nr:CYTH domain-containing protein [Candidatus Saccharimonadales bacterium]
MNEAPIEYEVKFFPINLKDIQQRLQDAGASIKTPERLMRRCVFATEANPGMTCTYVRIRDEGNKITMSAKQHAANGKIDSQKEYETTVGDFETTRHILLQAGLKQTGYQENKRETWQMPDGTLIELETWPQLPNYLEIEGKSEDAVKKTAASLRLDWNKHIIQSNDHLYAKHWNMDRSIVLEKLSHLTFESTNHKTTEPDGPMRKK